MWTQYSEDGGFLEGPDQGDVTVNKPSPGVVERRGQKGWRWETGDESEGVATVLGEGCVLG